jgi:hypothetical protein
MRAAVLASVAVLVGCTSAPPADSGPTWYKDVAPLVSTHCAGCHKPGGIGPFSLTDYTSARAHAAAMVGQVVAGRMPPWHAVETSDCKPRMGWKDDPRLTEAQKALLSEWARAGAPAGDAGHAAALPTPPALELKEPTQRVSMSAAYLVQGARDVFRCFPLSYEFTEDTWLTGLQVVPGNGKVVHHVLVWLDDKKQAAALAGPDGSYQCFGAPGFDSKLLGAWAPGAMPSETSPDSAMHVPKGSRIVINVHYHPDGQPETDLSALDLRFSTRRPLYESRLVLIGNATTAAEGLLPGPDDPQGGVAFTIPPDKREHTEDMQFKVPADAVIIPIRLASVATHMHYVGTDMRISVDRTRRSVGTVPGEPSEECLLETPHWDFHWQRGYSYDAPVEKLPTIGGGDVLKLHCRYDNSMQNPFVASALAEQGLTEPRAVNLGEQTLDEMCLGAFALVFPLRP